MKEKREMSALGAVISTVLSFLAAGVLLYGFRKIMGWDAASWSMISYLVILLGLAALIGSGISNIYDRAAYGK